MSKPLADQIVDLALALERGDLRPQAAGLKLRDIADGVQKIESRLALLEAREQARLSSYPVTTPSKS